MFLKGEKKMSEFFDKVKSGANKMLDEVAKVAKTASQKTNNAVTQTKLSYSAHETEGKIKSIYAEMGKKVYDACKAGGEIPDFAESIEKIDKMYEEIAELKAKIAELKESVQCEKCGEYTKAGSKFCPKCGAALTTIAEDFAEEFIENIVPEVAVDTEEAAEEAAQAAQEINDTDEPAKRVVTIKAKKPVQEEE